MTTSSTLMDFVRHITRIFKNIISMRGIPTLTKVSGNIFGSTTTNSSIVSVVPSLIGGAFLKSRVIDVANAVE